MRRNKRTEPHRSESDLTHTSCVAYLLHQQVPSYRLSRVTAVVSYRCYLAAQAVRSRERPNRPDPLQCVPTVTGSRLAPAFITDPAAAAEARRRRKPPPPHARARARTHARTHARTYQSEGSCAARRHSLPPSTLGAVPGLPSWSAVAGRSTGRPLSTGRGVPAMIRGSTRPPGPAFRCHPGHPQPGPRGRPAPGGNSCPKAGRSGTHVWGRIGGGRD
jgi:hypothetical protein